MNDDTKTLYVKSVHASTVRDIGVMAATLGVSRAEAVEILVEFYRAAQESPRVQAGKLLAR